MKAPCSALLAYIATLIAIVLLAVIAALICIWADFGSEVNLGRVIGALGFIGAAVTGLIGVIGTFRPKGDAPTAATESGDISVTEGGRPE